MQKTWNWPINQGGNGQRPISRETKDLQEYSDKCTFTKRRPAQSNTTLENPQSIREARLLDKTNGNTKWDDAIETELRALYKDHNCFKKLKGKNEIPSGYKYVPLLWVFAVKFDLRYRARCVAGGHVTADLEQDVYSGVVDLETAKIALVAAILTQLQIIAADISSAYIQAFIREDLNSHSWDWKGQFSLCTKLSMLQRPVEQCGTENWLTISGRWNLNLARQIMISG